MQRDGLSFTAMHWPAAASWIGGVGRGSPESRLVILLHGFPDAPESLAPWAGELSRQGFEVLVPTMRGYEPSSQRAGDYALSAVAGDVVAWIAACGHESAHIIGHDWGAATAYVVAAWAPEKVASLVTLAVPHMSDPLGALKTLPRQLWLSSYMAFFQCPGLAEAAVRHHDFALLDRLWARWSPDWTAPSDVRAAVHQTFRRPGVVAAALGYYRSLARLDTDRTRVSWRLMRQPLAVATLALTGANDGCMATELYDVLMPSGQPHVVVERVAGAGHWLHLERPDVVHPRVLEWLCSPP